MRWDRVPPCLCLQWIDNKVVSVLRTLDNANDKVPTVRKTKTANVWTNVIVDQPRAIDRYNKLST